MAPDVRARGCPRVRGGGPVRRTMVKKVGNRSRVGGDKRADRACIRAAAKVVRVGMVMSSGRRNRRRHQVGRGDRDAGKREGYLTMARIRQARHVWYIIMANPRPTGSKGPSAPSPGPERRNRR